MPDIIDDLIEVNKETCRLLWKTAQGTRKTITPETQSKLIFPYNSYPYFSKSSMKFNYLFEKLKEHSESTWEYLWNHIEDDSKCKIKKWSNNKEIGTELKEKIVYELNRNLRSKEFFIELTSNERIKGCLKNADDKDVLMINRRLFEIFYKDFSKREVRISEQEARLHFIKVLDSSDYYYSIETPTEQPYQFSGKKPISANTDLTIYTMEKKSLKKLINVEFKSGNPEPKQIDKDIEKLIREGYPGNWFHLLKTANSGTLPSLSKKFLDSFYPSMLIEEKDIVKCDDICNRLKEFKDPIIKQIWDCYKAKDKEKIKKELVKGKYNEKEKKDLTCKIFNNITKNNKFHNTTELKIKIDENIAIRKLFEEIYKKGSYKSIQKCNRLLLELIFPDAMKESVPFEIKKGYINRKIEILFIICILDAKKAYYKYFCYPNTDQSAIKLEEYINSFFNKPENGWNQIPELPV